LVGSDVFNAYNTVLSCIGQTVAVLLNQNGFAASRRSIEQNMPCFFGQDVPCRLMMRPDLQLFGFTHFIQFAGVLDHQKKAKKKAI